MEWFIKHVQPSKSYPPCHSSAHENDHETDGTLLYSKKNHNDCSTKRRMKICDLHGVEEVMS